ncbi:hypothetical protein SAMN05216266_101501 [Amycolatopsis marina]|uniref:Uncharacterized protein n=1 Tax=Amycolatopsis marina TaxID=490629 RepID=A0A1I0VU25_9PSEU|nr:hypothetical protein [Amycolatopsis marina]SFA79915.1 hypothetical protein SAMN05216266_101501 [Amycolatopsis marina]
MGAIETIGIAAGLFVLVLMALAPLLVELNDRLPLESSARPEPVPAPAWGSGRAQASA